MAVTAGRHAVLIGATGLVGSHLLQQLLADERYAAVTVFARREAGVHHAKLQWRVVDFDDAAAWRNEVRGDVLFSALGTTIAQAGSRDAQWKVDHTYQYEVARAAASNGVGRCVLISSAGASARSRVFYSRMKGQLEEDVRALGFRSLHILRPGLLAGLRERERRGELVGAAALRVLNAIGLFRAYRPVHADTVARAMINAAECGGSAVHEPAAVFTLAAMAAPG